MADPAFTVAVESLYRKLDVASNVLRHQLSTSDRTSLAARIAHIRKHLMPVNSEAERRDIGAALARLFSGWENIKSDPMKMVTAYVQKLQDLPTWAVLTAISEAERGRVEGLSPDYPPSAARLYQIAEGRIANVCIEKDQIDRILKAEVEKIFSHTPEELAALKAKSAEYLAQRAKEGDVERAIDDQRKRERDQRKKERHEADLIREYHTNGLEPVRASTGHIIVSLSLARLMGSKIAKLGPPPAARCGEHQQEDEHAS